MAISDFSAAKYLAERSDWSLTNLQMQKILYLAHMVYLGRQRGEPLIREAFEAWDYGPVCPVLHHKLKIYGAEPVGNIFRSYTQLEDNSNEAKILKEALDSLGNLSGGHLVSITHKRGGAWARNYRNGMRGIPIPNQDIIDEYNEDLNQ
ncbi:Panacea domain-containing protein [Candidatus Tokpelaia sp.]|uniref:Panacea domain-containing protein n=1 Tax=Candidatus Tokpelaia sp. TaxID=2233777 RepID=UPI0012720CBE|nr:type II toxin-antitoxin system antitoxin SocA domain-containing protein [Candidatus Tokpelaia sp.]KAA6406053.1 hypothetical protein DPQ22_00985 [Candidatus Tokpelaia sp.]